VDADQVQSIVEVRAALPSVVRHLSEQPQEAVYFGVQRRPEAVIISAERYQNLLDMEHAMSQTPDVDHHVIGKQIAAYDSMRDSATYLGAIYVQQRRAARTAGDSQAVREAQQRLVDLHRDVDAVASDDLAAVVAMRDQISAAIARHKTQVA